MDIDCLHCKQRREDSKSDCRVRGILYRNSCLLCEKEKVTSTYFGESSRTVRERLEEHFERWLEHCLKHCLEHYLEQWLKLRL